jgi:hypothetical protein
MLLLEDLPADGSVDLVGRHAFRQQLLSGDHAVLAGSQSGNDGFGIGHIGHVISRLRQ